MQIAIIVIYVVDMVLNLLDLDRRMKESSVSVTFPIPFIMKLLPFHACFNSQGFVEFMVDPTLVLSFFNIIGMFHHFVLSIFQLYLEVDVLPRG